MAINNVPARKKNHTQWFNLLIINNYFQRFFETEKFLLKLQVKDGYNINIFNNISGHGFIEVCSR
ncbi:MAG: hypothetical protein DWP95_04095 [Proteobacteria bacterium]|nr:MAG: hypothetical protein DWP95_04095 [Pseudomonadota bacterium]